MDAILVEIVVRERKQKKNFFFFIFYYIPHNSQQLLPILTLISLQIEHEMEMMKIYFCTNQGFV